MMWLLGVFMIVVLLFGLIGMDAVVGFVVVRLARTRLIRVVLFRLFIAAT